MKHPDRLPFIRTSFWVLILCFGLFPLSLWSQEKGPSEFAKMSEEQLQQEWETRLGKTNFQPIEMPSLIRPGGKYGERLFYFAEPLRVNHSGNAATGRLSIGANQFDYSRAISPFNQLPDSSITYFAIRSPEFDGIIAEQFGALEVEARTEDGKWDLAMITESLGVPPSLGSFVQDWENLPNFSWVMSSILVRRASQQTGSNLELVLQDGQLKEYSAEAIVTGDGPRNSVLAALYNPAALEKIGGPGEYPLWMLLAAAGVGLLLPLGFIVLRRPGRRRDNGLRPGEVEVLEEDPRFLDLRSDLKRAKGSKGLLKVLSTHFDDSEAINLLLAQAKIDLDRVKREAPAVEAESSESQETTDQGEETNEDAPKEGRKKAKIKIKSEDIKRKESVEATVPEESQAKKKTEPKEEKSKERMVKKDGRVREVVKEVERVVVKEQIDNGELKKRLENQETPEEKLQVAIAYWDAAYDMDGAINRELGSILRSHRIYNKVKTGFESGNIRSGLSELALSFGAGHTTKVRHILDRSEAVEKFVKDVEADRLAPAADRDDDRGRTAAHLAEVVRALQFSDRIARKELPGGARADYQKATQNILAGFVLDGTARDAYGGKTFDEMRVRLENRLTLFQDDVRFAGNQIPDDAVKRISKLVHSFAGDADSNVYYEAFLLRYGDLFDKLARYEDPPTLDELREWWGQAYEMVIHSFDYFRYSVEGKENSRAKLNVMMVLEGLKLHELPDGDVRPFSERVTDVPRAVRNAREMARSIGIARLDRVLIDGYYIHPKALEPVEE